MQPTKPILQTKPHLTITWNDAETARNITVGVAERDSGESLVRNTYRFEPDAYVEIEVSKVGQYTASVGVDSNERAIDFPTDSCNSKALDVAIRPDGTVASTFGSTEMACATGTAANTTE